MSLFVVSRRKVVFHQASLGASMVVYVPGAEQVQVFKDAAGTVSAAPANLGGKTASRGPQLSRVVKGQRTTYGQLPLELKERREKLKVWLAEDLSPPEADAFFYIFSPQVVVHGIRERNDEGKLVWRTAQLNLASKDNSLKAIETALADYMFANQGQNVCLAVVNDLKLFRKIQELVTPLGLTPLPMSTLKPQAGLTPLYSHMDFTLLHFAIMALGICMVVGMAVYYVFKQASVAQIQQEIDAITAQINAVSINPRVGHIRQAQAVLGAIERGYSVSPSTILAAAGQAMAPFGKISNIRLGLTTPEQLTQLGLTAQETLIPVEIIINEAVDVLLVDQAERAKTMLQDAPWIRSIVRHGGAGETANFILQMQLNDRSQVHEGAQP